ncbi:hypothetical protein [Candidatus Oscillochloris fontis]|uniref:NADH-quinone oxidoreductase subunit D-related protein n=1 Tax=Candidatus Oscillochloris fontis TaxID=2496868 RepID=UPI00101E153A|nr:hypothetical protein [Candidatus Oscillochloris fontis]
MTYILSLEPAVAAWRGPQRLVLKVVAEQITDVEYRLDLPLRSRSVSKLSPIQEVAQSCPTCSQAHSLAFALAVESLLGVSLPLRASRVRLVAAECERAISHLTTLEAIFALMGIATTAATLAELRTRLSQGLAQLVGNVAEGVLVVPGGIRRDPTAADCADLRSLMAGLSDAIFRLTDRVIDQRLILARTVAVGSLSETAAAQFRLSGPLARASGLKTDVRLDAPYGAYAALAPQMIVQASGDVYSRLVLLLLEVLESLKLSDRALDNLPDGAVMVELPNSLPVAQAEATVEAPRGALRYRVEGDAKGELNYWVEVAPQFDRLLARTLLLQAAPDDALLIALSTDPCSACQALRDA